MRRTVPLSIVSARPRLPARGVVAATVLGLALAGCGGRLFDGTPYAGDVQSSVPKAETAEVTPLGPAEAPPVPSVGGPLGTEQTANTKTYQVPLLAQTDADRAAMQQAQAQQRAGQQAQQQQRQAQLNAQRQAAFEAQQRQAAAQQQAQQQPAQQPTGTVAPLTFGQRRATAAPSAMEAMPRPASPQTYPNLGSVPEKPENLPTPEERAAVRNQLEADRAASGAPGALSFGNKAAGTAPAPAESKPAFSFNNRVVGTVKFDSGSTTMPAAGNSTVETVAKTAQSPKLRVVGYGAGDGAAQAKARAEAVAAALRAAGVDPARIVTGGSADTRANITDEQAARVEIYLAN
ncbi:MULTISPECIES: OmpA family protein [unclassified Inquilinus]|uniref:OmpA family protein n=1 Tax=unclassified Inquilinus TaxID=2645927 RepID=UPI003F8EFC6F